MWRFKAICLASFLVAGCVTTTGPVVSPGEICQVREELKVKALKYKLEKEKRVANVGYRLLKAIQEKRGSYPYIGMRFIKIDKYVRRLFNLDMGYGIAVAYVVDGGPADRVGIRAGDILKRVNHYTIDDLWDLRRALSHVYPGDKIKFEVIREGQLLEFTLIPEEVPLKVRFRMVDMQEVNAGATSDEVLVTYGLMRFIQSDDELAIILGHELAHIARGHIAKRFGTDLLSILIGIAAGYGAESISPGSGDIVMHGIGGAFSATFSREFEREADYYGILYAHRAGFDIEAGIEVWERFAIEVPESMVRDFFSTHPTSTERLIRIKKIVEELKAGEGGDES